MQNKFDLRTWKVRCVVVLSTHGLPTEHSSVLTPLALILNTVGPDLKITAPKCVDVGAFYKYNPRKTFCKARKKNQKQENKRKNSGDKTDAIAIHVRTCNLYP